MNKLEREREREIEKLKAKEKFCNFSIFFYCPFWLDFIAFFNALFDFQLSYRMQFEMQVMLLTYLRDGEKETETSFKIWVNLRITILERNLFDVTEKRKDHFETLIENYSQSISSSPRLND